LRSKPQAWSMKANRHVTKRDGRLEGDEDVEASDKDKEAQRDLTSLSTPTESSR